MIPLLQVTDLRKTFPARTGLFGNVIDRVHAVDGISFSIAGGRTLGLVGESGCGKSTAGRAILRLIEPTGGRIRFAGNDITQLPGAELRKLRRKMQRGRSSASRSRSMPSANQANAARWSRRCSPKSACSRAR
jgi:ABC-type oligopeptide transport system ATPase subunit